MDAVDPGKARALVADIAALPLAHDLIAACTVRTQGSISYLLGRGVPRGALAVAANFVPDLSPQGLDDHYLNNAVMRGQGPFARHPFSRRVAYDPDVRRPADWKRRGLVQVGDITVHPEKGKSHHIPGVSLGLAGGGPRWWVSDTTHRQPYANHYAPALWVSRQGRSPELMVIDTAQSKHDLRTLDEWRAGQNYPDAVTATAGIGSPFRVYARPLSLGQFTRLSRFVGLTGRPTPEALDRQWERLSHEDRRTAMTSFFRWKDRPGPDPGGYAGYSEGLRQTITSERPLFPRERDIGSMLDEAIKTFVPLEAYQGWLRRTDEAMARTRLPAMPPAMRTQAVVHTSPAPAANPRVRTSGSRRLGPHMALRMIRSP